MFSSSMRRTSFNFSNFKTLIIKDYENSRRLWMWWWGKQDPLLIKVMAKKNKHWIQDATASIEKRGTKGKCTPITKPGCTGKAKALAKTFKAMAKKK